MNFRFIVLFKIFFNKIKRVSGGNGDDGYVYVGKWFHFEQPGRKRDATPSGKGGDGGCGGMGGLPGKIFIVDLKKSNIKSFHSSGIFCGKF